MTPHFRYLLEKRRKGVSLALSIVLSFVVLLAQSVPAMSGHNTAAWMEICGDGGSYFIEVDENGEEQEQECAHCDYCLLPSSDAQGVHAASPNTSALIEFTTISYLSDRDFLPDSPEQYWSACRGPPIANSENNMSTNISLVIKEPIGAALNTWGNPCI